MTRGPQTPGSWVLRTECPFGTEETWTNSYLCPRRRAFALLQHGASAPCELVSTPNPACSGHNKSMERDRQAPTSRTLLGIWLRIGLQSFGGGAATLAMVRHAVVYQHRWVTEEEFTQDWALCQVAPGINLLAFAILIGRRLGGALGIGITLFGLLLPSVTLTILISAMFAQVHKSSAGQAFLHGVLPATVALGLLTAQQMARPPLLASHKEGRGALLFSVALVLGCALVMALAHVPVLAILITAGVVSALIHWVQEYARRRTTRPGGGETAE